MTMLRRIGILIVALLALACIEADAWAGKVGPEFRVDSGGVGNFPLAGALSTGGFVAVWLSTAPGGSGQGIYGQRYAPDGARLGNEIVVYTTTEFDPLYAAVAGLRSGGFVVVWSTPEPSHPGFSDVYGRLYNAAGAPVGGAFLISSATPEDEVDQIYPSVARLSGGGFVVAWVRGPVNNREFIVGQRFSETGAPLGGRFRVNTSSPVANFWGPSIAGLADGSFVITWTGRRGVFGQRFAAGGTRIGGEFTITSQGNQGSVAALSRGGFVVAWHATGGAFCQIYGAAGQRVGKQLWASSQHKGGLPAVTGLSNGGFVVTWIYEPQGDYGNVYAQIWSRDAKRVGTWFRVNTRTHYLAQGEPHLTNQSVRIIKGGFVVLWSMYGLEGPVFHVYGQRFSQ